MEITLNNTSAKKAKKAMSKEIARIEKKYVDQFGQEFMNNYKESTSNVADFLLEGVKEVYKTLCKPNGQFAAVTVDFLGQSRAVVTGIRRDDGSIDFNVCSNEDNIPTYGCDLFNAIFGYEVVDLVFGELKSKRINIELGTLKKEYNDIKKFYNELVDTMVSNADGNQEINIWVNKETA